MSKTPYWDDENELRNLIQIAVRDGEFIVWNWDEHRWDEKTERLVRTPPKQEEARP